MLWLLVAWMSGPASADTTAPMPAAAEDQKAISSQAVSVYRFWSSAVASHLYTMDEAEQARLRNQHPSQWDYEGIAFRVFAAPVVDGLLPVYRFWSEQFDSRFYTLDTSERDWLIAHYPGVWTYQGVAFYAYGAAAPAKGTMPVYRFWSPVLGDHFYTVDDLERFTLVSSYPGVWSYEGVAWYAYPPQEPNAPTFEKEPYLQAVTSDSATILWQTDAPADGEVQYRAETTPTLTACDPVFATRHRVVLTGLEPGTIYTYKAVCGPVSRVGAFRTAPRADEPLRFVVYGDTRTDVEVHQRMIARIAAQGPDVVFHTGDLVSSGRDYGLWQTEFFGPAAGLLRNVPLVPVLGNHDYLGAGSLWFYYFFERPLNQGWCALTYGNVRFVALDTNVDYSAGSPQYQWLTEELQSTAYLLATWHIVVFHHPPFTTAVGRSDDVNLQRQLLPLFEQHGVDAVFSGHSHVYERYAYHGIQYIVTGGGGAPLYQLPARKKPPVRLFGLSTYHYCMVEVYPGAGKLAITAVDLDGRTLDAFILSKPQ
jgi:predicted phosphodiesterase